MGTCGVVVAIIVTLGHHQYYFVNAQQQYLVTPENVTVTSGDNVTLHCRVDGLVGALQWTFNDFGLGLARSLPGYDRYSMPGSDDNTWDLLIVDAQPQDEGLFQCQILASSRSGPMRSDYAKLTVLSRPQPPILTSGPRFVVKDESSGLVQCISKGSRPPARLTWRLNGDLVQHDLVDTKVTSLADLTTMTIATLTLPVTSSMQDDLLTCEATNHDLNVSETISTVIVVDTRHQLSITAQDNGPVYEGDILHLTCGSQLPEDTEVSWTIGGQEVRGHHEASMSVEATRDLHNSVVSCATQTDKAAGYRLNINYGPMFVGDQRAETETVTGHNGDRIELTCEVDSNPAPSISWYNSQKVIGSGAVLGIIMSNVTQGQYSCFAEVPGFPVVSRSFQVKAQGPPQVLSDSSEKLATVGESATVGCEVRTSDTLALRLSWSHKGQAILPDNPDFSILDTIDGDIVKSVVLIKNVEDRLFGEFSCSATNQYGSNRSHVRLVKAGQLPRLVIVCSSLSVCLIIIVAIVIIITCRHSPSTSSSSSVASSDQDPYLQIVPKKEHTPDILHSHYHLPQQNIPPHYHHQTDHGHHQEQLVWTVPMCTSSVKSDLYSDHDNYAFLRDHRHHHDNHHHYQENNYAVVGASHQEYVDLDETSPGTHV